MDCCSPLYFLSCYPFSLCCSCVVSALFHFPFMHWPIVMPLTPPVWCRFGSLCLWTDSPLSNGANVLLCSQSTVRWKWASNSNFTNKPAASKTKRGCVDVLSVVVEMEARKEGRKEWRRKDELRLDSEVWRVASLLKTAPYLPTVSHASCVVL